MGEIESGGDDSEEENSEPDDDSSDDKNEDENSGDANNTMSCTCASSSNGDDTSQSKPGKKRGKRCVGGYHKTDEIIVAKEFKSGRVVGSRGRIISTGENKKGVDKLKVGERVKIRWQKQPDGDTSGCVKENSQEKGLATSTTK